jgi:hypothetical protein
VTTRLFLGLGWVAATALPAAILLALISSVRPRASVRSFVLPSAIGLAGGILALLAERTVLRAAQGTDDPLTGPLPLWIALAFVAPLEQAMATFAAVATARRWKEISRLDGVRLAIAAASGVALGEGIMRVALTDYDVKLAARAMVTSAALAACAGIWGYALTGTKLSGRFRRGFFLAWLGGTFAHGLSEHLGWQKGAYGIAATLPLFLAIFAFAYAARADLVGTSPRSIAFGRGSPASLRDVREALARRDAPLSVRWVVVGALVTNGVLFASLVGAVVLGRRMGVDFAALEETSARAAAPPFVLLGSAAALSFPIAGFLIARGSSTPSLREPALAAAVAIAVLMGMLGLAAPVALAFALACAPVALILACAGAWVGMAR